MNITEEIKDKIKDKKVYIKVHESDFAKIYAFCDPELIDKTLKSDKMTFHVNPKFYQGSLISLQEALEIISHYPNANIVGRLAYYAAKSRIVNKRAILWIQDKKTNLKVPHVILMRP